MAIISIYLLLCSIFLLLCCSDGHHLNFPTISLLRCRLYLEAVGPISGVWLIALVPGSSWEIQEGDGERTEHPGHQPRWETHADHELNSEETRHLPAGVPIATFMRSSFFRFSVYIRTNIRLICRAGMVVQRVALPLHRSRGLSLILCYCLNGVCHFLLCGVSLGSLVPSHFPKTCR